MRIAVDAMGGDFGPEVVIEGALWGAREEGCEIVLVGDKALIEKQLARQDIRDLAVVVHHASETVGMAESPAAALRRKKDSSLHVCFDLVRKGEAQGMVSAGNSGAIMAIGVMVLKTIEEVERPALALLLPTLAGGSTVFLDVGGNVDCKPIHLAQFAVMGSIYAKIMLNKQEPKVALLSIGEEESKGNDLTRQTNSLLKGVAIKYEGYIEGRDLYTGKVDVIVCDGFVGNVVLKVCEGMIDGLAGIFHQEIKRSSLARLGYRLMGQPLESFKRKFDYDEYGGAPLLGINGVAVVSHGGASARAIKNAVRLARKTIDEKVNYHLGQALAENRNLISFGLLRSQSELMGKGQQER